jgi:hypothetical protein
MNRNIPFWTLSVALLGSALSHPALANNTVTAIKLETPSTLASVFDETGTKLSAVRTTKTQRNQ